MTRIIADALRRQRYALLVQRNGVQLNRRPATPVARKPVPKAAKAAIAVVDTSKLYTDFVLPAGLDARSIVVGIASIIERESGLIRTLNALSPQCTHIFVYLNSHNGVPAWATKYSNVTIVLANGSTRPDLGPAGKFYALSRLPPVYYLTADDDIIYPVDYVGRMVEAIDRYSRKAVVSYHGLDIRLENGKWVFRRPFHFRRPLEQDRRVNVPGTGVAGLYSENVQVKMHDLSLKGTGVDPQLALYLKKEGIAAYCLAHSDGWLLDNTTMSSISAMYLNKHKQANNAQLIQTTTWCAPVVTAKNTRGSVACIVTAYKRTQNLAKQLSAIRGQSVPPSELLVWQNAATGSASMLATAKQHGASHILASPNMGVWPRFSIGLDCTSEYICIFDDDTIPGVEWLDSCMQHMQKNPGVYGAIGIRFRGKGRSPREQVGWSTANDKVEQVDLVGHSWFFKRDWLRYYMLEPRHGSLYCGEDYHLSIAVERHLGLGTFVPPHPAGNRKIWGSLDGRGLGNDDHALAHQSDAETLKTKMHNAYLATGWLPLLARPANTPEATK